MTTTSARRGDRPGRHRPRRLGGWQTAIGVLLVGAAAYSAGTTYYAGERAADRADCQARVNQQVTDALAVRDDANRRITAAQRALVNARLADPLPGITPRQADRAYLAALDDLQRVRDANPINPDATC